MSSTLLLVGYAVVAVASLMLIGRMLRKQPEMTRRIEDDDDAPYSPDPIFVILAVFTAMAWPIGLPLMFAVTLPRDSRIITFIFGRNEKEN